MRMAFSVFAFVFRYQRIFTALLFFTAFSSLSAAASDMIFVRYPAEAKGNQADNAPYFLPADKYIQGAQIVRYNPDTAQDPDILTSDFYAACDPDVSFNGKAIIFAGKKSEADTWQIWRMNADGTNKMQLTSASGNCVAPVHAGARFFLDDPEPVIQIIYAGDSHGWKNPGIGYPAYSIYAIDITGERTHRLSFNLNADFEPTVLPNGRIIYSSWQRYGERFEGHGTTALLAVNNDGTDLMPFYGNHEGPIYKSMAEVDKNGSVYFIETESPGFLGGGNLAKTGQSRPLHTYERITHSGFYTAPSILNDGSLLVSFRDADGTTPYGIFTMDAGTMKRKERIYGSPDWHALDVHSLAPHTEPKGRSNWLIPGTETGVYYALDVYRTNLDEYEDMERGTLKYIRVIEGIPVKDELHSARAPITSYAPSRILGVMPLEADGSFQFVLPASTPVTFQLLDEHHRAAATQQGWTWVMGNESRGCIGCHEDREMSPPNIFVDAVKKDPVNLVLPPERRRTADFKNSIYTLMEKNCTTSECHNSDATFRIADTPARKVYEWLLNSDAVIPGYARKSPLTGHITDTTPADISPVRIPEKVSIGKTVQIRFIEWIDLGAQWDTSEYLEN